MTFDKILVLDNKGNGGEVVEYVTRYLISGSISALLTAYHRFDAPATLLQREGGVLYNLAKKSGEYDELLRLATTTE